MSFSVTPGFGASVATELKGGAHHQRIIAHDDPVLSQIVPALTPNHTYADDQAVGSELLFQNAVRFSEDVVRLTEVKIVRKNSNEGLDLDLVFYSAPRVVAASDGQPFSIAASEAAGILSVVRIRAADFLPAGGHSVATLARSTLLRGTIGAAVVRAQLVARGTFTVTAVDGLAVSIGVVRS